MKINAQTLYLGDNGRCLCGEHLGATGRMTGRDISGQSLLALTPEVMAEARAEGIDAGTFVCEQPHCGRRPSLLYID